MSKTQAGCKMQNEDRRRFTLSLLFALRSPRFTLTCLRDAIASIGHFEVAWEEETGWKFVPSKKFKLQLDAACSQAPVETWNFQCSSWMTFIYLLNLQKAELTANLDMASHFVSRHLIAGDFDSFALKKYGRVATLEGINATIAEYQVMVDSPKGSRYWVFCFCL